MKNSKPIIVGIDVRDLKLAVTGTKTYLNEFIVAFENLADPDIQFCYLDADLPVYGGDNKFLKALEHLYFFWWKQFMLPFKAWRKGCEVLFCTDYFVPLVQPGFATITVFHDALFFEIPEQYNPVWLAIFKTLALPGARKSARVVVPSDFSKFRLQHFTGLPLEKFITIYEGPKTLALPEQPGKKVDELLQQLQGSHYFLHVGSLDKRKNLPRLIEAFKLLKEQGLENYKLVLVGKASPKIFINNEAVILETIEKLGLQDDVILTGYLSDEDLSFIYRKAAAYVFPSVYEGFGIPLVEAFYFNLPVAIANNSCLPEIGGNAVISFDPLDVKDMADKMNALISDQALRATLQQNAQKRLSLFSWEDAARQMNALFKSTALKA